MPSAAICWNLLIGYNSHRDSNLAILILPIALSLSFLLVADNDSPRGGLIHVRPQNLYSVADSLKAD